MKKYLIYTTNDTEPFTVESESNLIEMFKTALEFGEEAFKVEHYKELVGLGKHKYTVMLNVNNIVSITTSEKV